MMSSPSLLLGEINYKGDGFFTFLLSYISTVLALRNLERLDCLLNTSIGFSLGIMISEEDDDGDSFVGEGVK